MSGTDQPTTADTGTNSDTTDNPTSTDSTETTATGESTDTATTTQTTEGETSDSTSPTSDPSETSDTTSGGSCPQAVELPSCEVDAGEQAGECATADDCMMGQVCYTIQTQGYCGECDGDAQCPNGGCTPPNPFVPSGSVCNTGKRCGGCQSYDACNDPEAPFCATVYTIENFLPVQTCSECASDGDCPNDRPNCAPIFEDLTTFSGTRACVPDCSLPRDHSCEVGQDQACQTGICSPASFMGFIEIGLCGECENDEDCAAGQTCESAEIDFQGQTMTGSSCQD